MYEPPKGSIKIQFTKRYFQVTERCVCVGGDQTGRTQSWCPGNGEERKKRKAFRGVTRKSFFVVFLNLQQHYQIKSDTSKGSCTSRETATEMSGNVNG